MNKFSEFMEKYFVPVAAKLNENKFIAAVRDAFILNFPLTMTASLILLLNFVVFGSDLPISLGYYEATASIAEFFTAIGWPILQGTIDIMAITIAFLIGRNLALEYKSDDLMGGLVGLASVFIVSVKVEGMYDPQWFGATGLFVSILVPLVSVYVFIKLGQIKRLKITLPDMVPPAVSRSFDKLIPIMITLFTLGTLNHLFTMFLPKGLHVFIFEVIQTPLQSMGDSVHTLVILYSISNFLWFFGIHGPNTIAAVRDSIFSHVSPANLTFLQEGGNIKDVPHLVHPGLYDAYANAGGSGMTLPLIIGILFQGKREDYRQISKLSLAPGIFNINETMIFGIPIVLNPIFLFPFVLIPAVVLYIAYFLTVIGFISPIAYTVPWTTPAIIAPFLGSGLDFMNLIVAALLFVLAIFMWLPFVKLADKEIKNK